MAAAFSEKSTAGVDKAQIVSALSAKEKSVCTEIF